MKSNCKFNITKNRNNSIKIYEQCYAAIQSNINNSDDIKKFKGQAHLKLKLLHSRIAKYKQISNALSSNLLNFLAKSKVMIDYSNTSPADFNIDSISNNDSILIERQHQRFWFKKQNQSISDNIFNKSTEIFSYLKSLNVSRNSANNLPSNFRSSSQSGMYSSNKMRIKSDFQKSVVGQKESYWADGKGLVVGVVNWRFGWWAGYVGRAEVWWEVDCFVYSAGDWAFEE